MKIGGIGAHRAVVCVGVGGSVFFNPGKGFFVRCDECTAGTGFHREIAERHAAFHGERCHGGPRVFDDESQGAAGGNGFKDGKCQVFCGGTGGKFSRDRDAHGARRAVDERLRGEDVFDFRCADPEAQGTQRTVRRGVAVAADDDHAGAHEALFVHQNMFNALIGVVGTVEGGNAVFPAVLFEGLGLDEACFVVDDARRDVVTRNDVVNDAEMSVRDECLAAARGKACKGLRRRVFVCKVRVAVEKNGVGVDAFDRMGVNDLFVESAGCRHGESPVLSCSEESVV